MEDKMIKMYDLVFQDMVESYVDGMEEEDKVKLSKEDIKDIAYKMIYKQEYMWEIINETIDNYIGDILRERGEENE